MKFLAATILSLATLALALPEPEADPQHKHHKNKKLTSEDGKEHVVLPACNILPVESPGVLQGNKKAEPKCYDWPCGDQNEGHVCWISTKDEKNKKQFTQVCCTGEPKSEE